MNQNTWNGVFLQVRSANGYIIVGLDWWFAFLAYLLKGTRFESQTTGPQTNNQPLADVNITRRKDWRKIGGM